MNHRELDCDVVRDLLPLYHDGVVSETTEGSIKEHLENCSDCKKEYEAICIDVLVGTVEMATGKKFSRMMKKTKRKRFLVSAVAVALICIAVIGGYFLQLQMPIVNIPGDEITVYCAYRYKTEEGYKLFVLYSYPSPGGHTKGDISLRENENTLVMNMKKPLLTQALEERPSTEAIWRYEYGYCSGDHGEMEYTDFDKVEFAGKVIWSKTENADDVIPEYVYAYEDFEACNGNVISWTTDLEKGYVGAGYKDGSFVAWDLSGNVLHDTRQ